MAPGLEPLDVARATMRFYGALADEFGDSAPELAIALKSLPLDAIVAHPRGTPLPQSLVDDVARLAVAARARVGPGKPEVSRDEKTAMGIALRSVAFITPRTLARVMGIDVSTLYAYANPKRQTRPSQKRLYLAAFLLRRLAWQCANAAQQLETTAATTLPDRRGRRQKNKEGTTNAGPGRDTPSTSGHEPKEDNP
jgi:hypothetical protein